MRVLTTPILCCLGFALLAIQPSVLVRADDEMTETPDAIWWEVAAPLQRREYALAENIIQNELDSPDKYDQVFRLQADLAIVKQLVELAQGVTDQCNSLEPGYEVRIAAAPYRFVSFDSDKSGKNLSLRNRRGLEGKYSLNDLDASSWIGLGESKMSDWEDKKLVLAVFWAFDRNQNTKLARSYLNSAAGDGIDVKIWLDRLAQMEAKKRQPNKSKDKPKTPSERIVGKWRVAIDGGVQVNIDIRPKGKATIFFEEKLIMQYGMLSQTK